MRRPPAAEAATDMNGAEKDSAAFVRLKHGPLEPFPDSRFDIDGGDPYVDVLPASNAAIATLLGQVVIDHIGRRDKTRVVPAAHDTVCPAPAVRRDSSMDRAYC